MLAHLTVRDLATLAHVEIDLPSGLVVFTGETGAGKSMLVESLRFALGGRSRGTLVREGAERAEVVATFRLPEGHPAHALLADAELTDTDAPDTLLLRRIVRPGGRSVFQVNGVTVPLRSLEPLRPLLVDLTSQHEHVRLLDPRTHREVIDGLPDVTPAFASYRTRYTAWREAIRELERLSDHVQTRRERLAWLRELLGAADDLAPESGEEARLEVEAQRMAHAEDIQTTAARIHALLVGAEPNAETLLEAAAGTLRALHRLDPEMADRFEPQLEAVLTGLQGLAVDVQDYGEGIEADPDSREDVEARLEALRRLRRQFGCNAGELDARIAATRTELEELERSEERTGTAQAAVDSARKSLETAAGKLHRAREAAAPAFVDEVQGHLAQLAMPHARLDMVWRALDEPGPDGPAELRIHAQTNPGEGFHSLDRVASGGELSRMLLAIKPALQTGDPVLVTIFDEVDSGISGATAVAVARLLRRLARGRQVICISHLPQIAAAADHHVHVSKQVEGDRTFTCVDAVTGQERLEVLGTMLGGESTDTSLAHAQELVRRALGA